MKQILSKPIVLIGLMGSGKSAIGKMLSERIGVSTSDTDKIIEIIIDENEIIKLFFKYIKKSELNNILL